MLSHSSTLCHVRTMSGSHSRYGVHVPGVPEFLRQCGGQWGESSRLHKSQEETGGIPALWKPAGKKWYSGISAVLFPGLPQRWTSLVPKQLACFFFMCVCVFVLFVVCLFVLQVMKIWAGVWEHEQWNLSSTDPCPHLPSHCPVLDHLPGNEAEYDTLRLTRYALEHYSGGKFKISCTFGNFQVFFIRGTM